MSKYARDARGRFKKRIESPYNAGWDSVENGADTENSNFAWFTSPASTKEWESGRHAALDAAELAALKEVKK